MASENMPSLSEEINDLAKSFGVDLSDEGNDDLTKGIEFKEGRQDGLEGDEKNDLDCEKPGELMKSEDGDGDGDEDGEGDGDGDGDELGGDDDTEKGMASLVDMVKGWNDAAEAAIDASEFLKSFTEANSAKLGDLEDTIEKSLDAQDKVNLFMAKGMSAMAKMIEGMSKSLEEVTTTINAIAGRPQPVRSVRAADSALTKSFGTEAPADDSEDPRVMEAKLFKAIDQGIVPISAAATWDRTRTVPAQFADLVKSVQV